MLYQCQGNWHYTHFLDVLTELALYPFFGCATDQSHMAGEDSHLAVPRGNPYSTLSPGWGPGGFFPSARWGGGGGRGVLYCLDRLFEIRKGDRAVSNSFENFPWVVGAHSPEDLGPALSHPT